MISRKNVLSVLITILFVLSLSHSPKAAPFGDAENDVYPSTSYVNGDIIMVEIVGSEIRVTLNSFLDLSETIVFMMLFSHDNDRTNFEAALILTLGSTTAVAYWTAEEVIGPIQWNKDISGSRYRLSSSTIAISFREYDDLVSAEVFLLTLIPVGDGYYDWAPNTMAFSRVFEVFNSIIKPYSANPPGGSTGYTSTPTTTSNPSSTTPTGTTGTSTSTSTTTTPEPTSSSSFTTTTTSTAQTSSSSPDPTSHSSSDTSQIPISSKTDTNGSDTQTPSVGLTFPLSSPAIIGILAVGLLLRKRQI